jgi:putative tRNA adenosine deaminase-associated protein
VSYFAVALARTADGWSAQQVDLDGVQDVDELADLLRDLDPAADTALLLIEEDDEYMAALRVDEDTDEPRVFLSDGRAVERYRTAQLIADAAASAGPAPAGPGEPATDDDPGADGEPLGDPGLLADLGTRARELLALCAHEGTLPADMITEVCERAGCLDELEALRLGA